MLILTILLALPVALLLLLCAVLWLECSAALVASRKPRSLPPTPPRLAVLVPAHNEAGGIQHTLEQLILQVEQPQQVVVIADNCSDATAEVARGVGVTVLERFNERDRGKGFALDYGLKYLAADPPEIVVMVDADCDLTPGTIDHIAHQSARTGCPVQSLYLMEKPLQPQAKDAVSAFAFKVKNLVRPLGLQQWGQPCLLTGTGMAFPWDVVRSVDLASGEIVEDMKLGLDLAIAGYAPQFCGDGLVLGRLPSVEAAATSQRTRWEHGHLQMLQRYVPPLLGSAVRQFRLDLLATALELAIPPLSLLVVLWVGVALVTVLVTLLGWVYIWPFVGIASAGGLLLISILGAWVKFGREDLPLQTLLSIPLYILWKIPLYFKFLRKPEAEWVRTERDGVESEKS
ncbi:MAG: glycosyltransferase [Spirulina sp. SIO3F2]|nr:glycosyltransferase [Spirulina sp. SIO3F2]